MRNGMVNLINGMLRQRIGFADRRNRLQFGIIGHRRHAGNFVVPYDWSKQPLRPFVWHKRIRIQQNHVISMTQSSLKRLVHTADKT